MPRYKLLIEYHGGPYQGWMKLPGIPTVQGALEEAGAKLDGGPVEIVGAGRTDAGVRPHPIAVLKAERTPDEFHARFSAASRHYRYVIVNRRADLALERGLAWRVPAKLDASAMHEAAQLLLGKHDFTTFRDTACQAASPQKTLDRFDVARFGDRIEFTLSARSFLHRQVRSMVGCLALVGMGRWREGQVAEALEARDRAALGLNAPPEGLYFVRARY